MDLINTGNGIPSVDMVMDVANFPFVDGPRQAEAKNNGVVKLKNIPFTTKRSEIIAFLGRNARILADSEEPVHIIMDRATSKTMDAYVEFQTPSEAVKAAERHHNNILAGRVSRLGDRPIEVELSSQALLMKDLFPLAKGIVWDGPQPKFLAHNSREPWENFKGFISCEEMTMLVKHVEVPHRSPYSKECPQRPYESLISILRKFPWYMTAYITLLQRHAVYNATRELIVLLRKSVERDDDPINLDQRLFKRLVASALSCKGFTALQKDNLCIASNTSPEIASRDYGLPFAADKWRHLYTLVPKPGIPLNVVEWYVAVIRDQTRRDHMARPLTQRLDIEERAGPMDTYWGYFWVEVNYAQGPQFDEMSLSQCAHIELSAIERILKRAFGRN